MLTRESFKIVTSGLDLYFDLWLWVSGSRSNLTAVWGRYGHFGTSRLWPLVSEELKYLLAVNANWIRTLDLHLKNWAIATKCIDSTVACLLTAMKSPFQLQVTLIPYIYIKVLKFCLSVWAVLSKIVIESSKVMKLLFLRKLTHKKKQAWHLKYSGKLGLRLLFTWVNGNLLISSWLGWNTVSKKWQMNTLLYSGKLKPEFVFFVLTKHSHRSTVVYKLFCLKLCSNDSHAGLFQREPFLEMFYTINSSPSLVAQKCFVPTIILSNYQ